MKSIFAVLLCLPVAACSSTSGGPGSSVSAPRDKSAAHFASRNDACGQARQSQEGAAVMGALLGAVGDFAPYGSRNGWAVNRAAYAGRRMASVAESASSREASRRC